MKAKAKKNLLKRRSNALESMASHLRETVNEAARQLEAEQFSNAFQLLRGIWPAVVFCTHRRFHASCKARDRSTTAFITSLAGTGLPVNVVSKMQRADIAAVMGTATPGNVQSLIEASITALDATEPAASRRRRAEAAKSQRRRFSPMRWVTAACGLLMFAR